MSLPPLRKRGVADNLPLLSTTPPGDEQEKGLSRRSFNTAASSLDIPSDAADGVAACASNDPEGGGQQEKNETVM